MQHVNHSNEAAISQGKGKEKAILFLIGLIGAAGLVFVLNMNSGKSAFSQNEGPAVERTELVAQR